MDVNTIMCVTEAQHKYLRVNITNNIERIHSHRDVKDRKDGGLTIMIRKGEGKKIEKLDT